MQRSALARRGQIWLAVLVAAGAVAFAITLAYSPQRAWASLLVNNSYVLSLALYGVVWVALNYVLSAGWSVAFRRVPEALSAYLVLGALFMLALLLGRGYLYAWSNPAAVAASPLLQQKAVYLNTPFFAARMVLALAVWCVFAYWLRWHSVRQDTDGKPAHTRRNQVLSAVFLSLFSVTFIFASIDWFMSLEPAWFSTIFPPYAASGMLLGGSAAVGVLLVWLRRAGQLPGLTDSHIYEASRIICATSTFWAYIWFSQYMLIYYANIPEEAFHFAHRVTGGWAWIFWANPVLNWLIPLVILIPASSRRSSYGLLSASVVVLIGRWFDLYLIVVPSLSRTPVFGLTELLMLLGFVALLLLVFVRSFGAVPPIPERDPRLAESLQFQN